MSTPTGAKRLVVAQGVLGLGSYALLVAAGRTMDATGFAAFAVFWSVVFSFGLGLYGPLELLLLRLAALRRTSADHVEIPRLVTWYLWVGLAAGLVAAAFLVRSLDGSASDAALVATAGFGYFLLLRTLAVQRGVAAGRGDYPRYARQVGADGMARLILAGALLGLGATSAGTWAMAVCAAGLAGALAARRVTIGPVGIEDDGSQPSSVRRSVTDALALTAGTSVSVILSNSLPAAAAALGASGAGLAGFSAAVLVSRIPLFFAGLGQAIVVPRVASATGDPGDRRRGERRILGAIAVVASAVTILVALLTGRVIQVAFPASQAPDPALIALLALATGLLLFALVGQGILLGRGAVGWVAAVWVCALLTALVTLGVTGGDPELQVALASTLSSGAACAVLVAAVTWLQGRPVLVDPAPVD